MRKDNLTGIKKPETFNPMKQEIHNGARKLLATALEVEINNFLEHYSTKSLNIQKNIDFKLRKFDDQNSVKTQLID